ncbi:glycoside hydrolase family 140 protein [Pedobacter immunditicola]|uniref:glycoside hydrolase family 140 protein n=1 Tax=Pedobacter immunditicola TaxID=3133440 RepID=UPI0030B62ACD
MITRTTRFLFFALVSLTVLGCANEQEQAGLKQLKVSENGRYLMTDDNKPFFWLADTGWLLFNKLNRDEADQYLEDRKQKGFNVIQVMVLHSVPSVNVYGDTSLVNADVSMPDTTKGNSFKNEAEYDFWDHVDYIVDKAAEKGLYMALVPVWGTDVKAGKVSVKQAELYAEFLSKRYRDRSNIIWLNGGDIKGSDSIAVWQTIGSTLRKNDPNHLITFHPRGRTASSEWFHSEKWMDFNMVQSGHRRYDQDTSKNEKLHYGEDNWKYMEADYKLSPIKPTIDGEPSYEGIPQGLHDTLQPRWTANDVRRYGYWSVFSGAFGYTYGQNSVMQFHSASDKETAYGSSELWDSALNAPGASQMVFLKDLLLSRSSYFDRVPDQSIIAGENGKQYNRLLATRGKDFVMVYSYTGGEFDIQMAKIPGVEVKASWFNPRNGETTDIGNIKNEGKHTFQTPGEKKDGNDWVLLLDKI